MGEPPRKKKKKGERTKPIVRTVEVSARREGKGGAKPDVPNTK